MRTPMPSPFGTNRAGLFINSDLRGAAYDAAAALSEESAAELLAFLQGKLTDVDLAAFCKMAGIIDQGMTMDDEDELAKRLPTPRTNAQAQDQRGALLAARVARQPIAVQRSFAERFPHAAKIKVS